MASTVFSRALPPPKHMPLPLHTGQDGRGEAVSEGEGEGEGEGEATRTTTTTTTLARSTTSHTGSQRAVGNALSLPIDAQGKARYDAIALQGHAKGRLVQTRHVDMVPLAKRLDLGEKDREMERPSEDEVAATTEKTRLALEKITNGKIAAARPKNLDVARSDASYVRYTPAGQVGAPGGGQERIIKMVEVQEDPMEPSKWKAKKVPRGPPSPPAPVLHSPPRKVTAQEQKDWMIPPCISNWKNTKGYTIPLDKRLSADGRGLNDIEVSDNFAKFSEALHTAERVAREDVRQRAVLQQKIVEKAKADKEEYLRKLAQQAREVRGGLAGRPQGGRYDRPTASDLIARDVVRRSTPPRQPRGLGLAGYGSGGDESDRTPSEGSSRSRSLSKTPPRSRTPVLASRARPASSSRRYSSPRSSEGEDDEAFRARERIRADRRRELERELRLNNMGKETRAKVLAKEQQRDISEKIALGLAKPTMSKESMFDARLFNQSEGLGDSLQGADDDSYNIYDKPLFSGSSAAAAIYGRPGNLAAHDDESEPGGGLEAGGGGGAAGFSEEMMKNDRFGLGLASGGRGFSGVDKRAAPREGPVQFEKDVSDPFAINAFLQASNEPLAAASEPKKRGLQESLPASGGERKRYRDDD